ncbi:MAG: helix-turn-helix domain-containing protein [Ferroplasma sp.]
MNINKCPLSSGLKHLNGKWEPLILKFLILNGESGYGTLYKNLSGITPKALNSALKKLLDGMIVEKKILSTVPYRVMYKLTEKGKALEEPLNRIETIEANCKE